MTLYQTGFKLPGSSDLISGTDGICDADAQTRIKAYEFRVLSKPPSMWK